MKLSTWKELSSIFQALVTSVAIIIGGLWAFKNFVLHREPYQRATLSHEIKHISLPENKVLLDVKLIMTNTGNTLLSISQIHINVKQIQPPYDLDFIKAWKNRDKDKLWQANWHDIAHQKCSPPDCHFEIEPGQHDEMNFDFILDANIQIVRIQSRVFNDQTSQERDLMNLYELREPSSKTALSEGENTRE
jgi:hypothetical protein